MNKVHSFITALLLLSLCSPSLLISARETVEKDSLVEALLKENLFRAGINISPYEYRPAPETAVPRGYKPFYISHYGRHGARSDWGGRYAETVKKYDDAHDAGLLTPEGETMRERVKEIVALHNNMDGRLTPLGAAEHRQIAGRMYGKYKSVFRRGSRKVRAVSSIIPRCIVSMAAFTAELVSRQPDLDLSWDTGSEFMKYCSSEDPRDVRTAVKDFLAEDGLVHVPDTAAFKARLFTDPDRAFEVVGSCRPLMDETYLIGAISVSFDRDDYILRRFTEDDIYLYCRQRALDLYLRQCNSLDYGKRRMPEVEPLVKDIIDKAEQAISTGEFAADLRFGHDWQVLALASRVGIRGVAERLDKEAAARWPGVLYTPFAANIQMIFYRGKSADDILVKFYLNEREASLIIMDGGPYYKWEDLKRAIRDYPESW